MQIHLSTTKDVAVLRSKEWFSLDEPDHELLGQTLTFRLQSLVRFKNKTVFSSVETRGQVLMELPTKEIIQVASVEYQAGVSHGNPVTDYLQRHGSSIEQPVNFEKRDPAERQDAAAAPRARLQRDVRARVGRLQPHPRVARLLELRQPARHHHARHVLERGGAQPSSRPWAAENNVGRVRSFHASLTGMVLPNDDLEVRLQHVAMVAGRKIIKVEASNKETEEKVLLGEAEVEQPVSAYVFTGQGSQEQGMGMELYASSAVAKEVWDRADKHFMDNYGELPFLQFWLSFYQFWCPFLPYGFCFLNAGFAFLNSGFSSINFGFLSSILAFLSSMLVLEGLC